MTLEMVLEMDSAMEAAVEWSGVEFPALLAREDKPDATFRLSL
jgi:hypothetical protein